MAVQAYIDYEKTMKLVDDIGEKKDRIDNLLNDELLQKRVQEIRDNYGGEAATAFETRLKDVIRKVEEDIDELTENLRKEATTQKEAFEAQDKSLAG